MSPLPVLTHPTPERQPSQAEPAPVSIQDQPTTQSLQHPRIGEESP